MISLTEKFKNPQYALQILNTLTDKKRHKKGIHELVTEQYDDTCSIQTLGRYVEDLKDLGLLENGLVHNPDYANQLTITAFTATEEGVHVLKNHIICPDCGEVHNLDNEPHEHRFVPGDEYTG